MDGTVLVADDDRTIRTVLTQALTRAGCKVHATSSLMTLMRWVDEGKGDLVISDVMMPDGNGLETLPQITDKRPGLPVIIISAQNTIMTAIQATEKDAYDYLPKPFDLPDLMKRAARALDQKRRLHPAKPAPGAAGDTRADAAAAAPQEDLPLVGRTPGMQALYRLVARVMNTDLPVLITGESGTGKSLIAKAIHDFSDRRTLPFVVASAGDLEGMDGPAMVVSRAKGGSILFDEVGDLSEEAQAKIVRMLDAFGESAPRIMASSQKDLMERMEAGQFRQDLFYRLGGVTISVPALRERVDDIPLLASHFLARAERDGFALRRLSPEAMDLIRAYSWPGNVRQLENTIRRLTVTSQADEIGKPEVETVLGNQPAIEPLMGGGEGDKLSASVAKHLRRYFDLHGGVLPPPGLYARILREVEMPLIEIALEATGGNQAKCADLLGINRNTLRKKITDLDIRVTRRRKLM
jgi:two-component system nitrogen regulation response regulator GlnG